jgi:AAA domain/NrS-1  polymerase HBD domain
MLPPDFAKIPPELKARSQWVCWRHDKSPVNPKTGGNAQADNPDTWGTFDQAKRYYLAHQGNGIAGVGYEFSFYDPYTGIDLDECRDPDTGELRYCARELLEYFASNSEISPRGQGIHILTTAKWPSPTGNQRKLPCGMKIEVYDRLRYFTMTGAHLEGTPTTIGSRQEQVTDLHRAVFIKLKDTPKESGPSPALELSDQELIDKACAADDGGKFKRLWQGDTTGYATPSEADYALVHKLAFWTNKGRERIDRLFRRSGLCPDPVRLKKWERLSVKTIEKALANTPEGYTGWRIENHQTGAGKSDGQKDPACDGQHSDRGEEIRITLADVVMPAANFINLDMPPRRTLLAPWLLESSMGMIVGWRGVGKSMFAMGIAQALARGEGFGPWPGGTPIKCLYLDGEMVQTDVAFRLIKLAEEIPENLFIYSDHYANSLGLPSANLLNEDWRKEMKALLLNLDVKLLVVDNIASLAPGIDENSKKDWDPINQFFLDLRYNNIITIFIHHSNKEGEQRGTSGREDNIDFSIMLEQPKKYKREDGCNFVVKFKKARVAQADLYLIGDTEFSLLETSEGKYEWTFASVKESARVGVLTYLNQGISYDEITELVGVTKGRISQIKQAAIKEGLISKDGKLTTEGRVYMEQKN